MAILSILIINNHGQPRLLKFYHEVVGSAASTLPPPLSFLAFRSLTPFLFFPSLCCVLLRCA